MVYHNPNTSLGSIIPYIPATTRILFSLLRWKKSGVLSFTIHIIHKSLETTPLGGPERWYAFARFFLEKQELDTRLSANWEHLPWPFPPDNGVCHSNICRFTKFFCPRSQRTGCQTKFFFKPHPSSQRLCCLGAWWVWRSKDDMKYQYHKK